MTELTYADMTGDGGSDIVGQVQAQQSRLQARLARCGQVLAVMSGKGGVGKSTVTCNLALGLARRGFRVGVVDADLNGSSMAKFLGLRGHRLQSADQGVAAAVSHDGVRLMSVDFFVEDDREPLIWEGPEDHQHVWRGMLESHSLREMVADTDWGDLDFLLLDLPPGGDRLATVCDTLGRVDGIIAVGIGSEVSQLVVGRSLSLARKHLKKKVLGIVWNMRRYYDWQGQRMLPLFDGGTLPEDFELDVLGDLPFDARMVHCCDSGDDFVAKFPQSPVHIELDRIIDALMVSINREAL